MLVDEDLNIRFSFFDVEDRELLDVIVHDLREPIRSIKSFGNFLQEDYEEKLNSKGKMYLHRIISSAERLDEMLTGLYKLYKIGDEKEERQEIDLNEIVKEIIIEEEEFLEERNGLIKSGLLPIIKSKKGWMKELFCHLIKNGMIYNKSSQPMVEIACKMEGNNYIFTFKDNGIPIKKKDYERIFKIFERLHTREEYTGIGMGLAICKKIVDLHKGKIWVEGGSNGNTFFIAIPIE